MNPVAAANRQLCYFILILLGCLVAFHANAASSAQSLSLDSFLSQVRRDNSGVRGSMEVSSGAELHSKEGELLISPTVFGNVQFTHDGKPQLIPLFSYDFQDSYSYTFGFSQTTKFGLNARLYFNSVIISYVNPQLPPAFASFGGSGNFGGYNAATTIELTQSLWGNGFGRSTRANQDFLEAQSLASSYSNRFAARTSLAEAENAYWRLGLARQAVTLTQDNYERAQKNYDWSARRAHLQLGDKSDELQARAALDLRKLDLQSSLDEEKSASRAFNTARGVESDQVEESLPPVTLEMVMNMSVPKRGELRDDVKAAAQQERAAIANTAISLERDTPTLDAFGSIALNGQDLNKNYSNAVQQAISTQHPTAAVGLRFSSPLDIGLVSDTRAGWRKEQAGAELNYQRKLFEQSRSWNDLNNRLNESRNRLKLARSIELVQQSKMENERARLRNGRATTFQVLIFEQDYFGAELYRIRAQSEVLGILTQMKIFGEAL